MKAQITVLIAVYNAEQTLRRCLDSMLAQTLPQWQAVCVDDCSTDHSWAILQDYAARDHRLTVVRLTENSGQAHARNIGLKHAEADVVTFLDSDDWLSSDCLERVVATFEAHPLTDTVLLNLMNVAEGQQQPYPMPHFDVLSGHEAFLKSLGWDIHGVYAARRKLYKDHPYDETCRAYSDDLTTHLHYFCSREVRQCGGTYYYWQNPQSVTHKPTVRRFDLLKAKERMRECLIEIGADKETIDHYETLRWLALVDACMFYHVHGLQLSSADRREGLNAMLHAWKTIDRKAVDSSLLRKFGYRRMPSWALFRCQEWLYFSLRGLLGKNI